MKTKNKMKDILVNYKEFAHCVIHQIAESIDLISNDFTYRVFYGDKYGSVKGFAELIFYFSKILKCYV